MIAGSSSVLRKAGVVPEIGTFALSLGASEGAHEHLLHFERKWCGCGCVDGSCVKVGEGKGLALVSAEDFGALV